MNFLEAKVSLPRRIDYIVVFFYCVINNSIKQRYSVCKMQYKYNDKRIIGSDINQ